MGKLLGRVYPTADPRGVLDQRRGVRCDAGARVSGGAHLGAGVHRAAAPPDDARAGGALRDAGRQAQYDWATFGEAVAPRGARPPGHGSPDAGPGGPDLTLGVMKEGP